MSPEIQNSFSREIKIKISQVEGGADDQVLVQQELQKLKQMEIGGKLQLNPVDFEKDDDSNFHIQFMAACANLRARNYRIEEVDFHKVKMIAGKIIPAIATTTAMTTGLASCELLKVCGNLMKWRAKNNSDDPSSKRSKMEENGDGDEESSLPKIPKDGPYGDVESYKNAFVNLALPLFVLSEPMPPLQVKSVELDPIVGGPVKAKPEGFSSWDKIEVNIPNCTVEQFLDHIEESLNLEVQIIGAGRVCLYNAYFPKHTKERKGRCMHELYEQITKTKITRKYIVLEINCCDMEDDVDVNVPTVKLVFRE
jgi:ubiquitin-activating enzyme E1